MQINKINSMSFRGMWAPIKVSKKEIGTCHVDKCFITLYDMVYHPWNDETISEIQNITHKYHRGRIYSVMDTNYEDTHFKCNICEMNRVRVGNAIRHEDRKALIKQGYTEKAVKGIPSDEEFKRLYPNASYAAYDVSKIDAKKTDELAKKYFPNV